MFKSKMNEVGRNLAAASSLVDNALLKEFDGTKIEGKIKALMLMDSQSGKESTKEEVAYRWLQENYDSLCAVAQAVGVLLNKAFWLHDELCDELPSAEKQE